MDAFVEQQVLAALTPAAVEVSLRAADQVRAERAELERLWSQPLERRAGRRPGPPAERQTITVLAGDIEGL